MKNITFSVIVPHYNSPTTIVRLLDSIPDRDDIEIIVVDDCSNWECYEKLQSFHKQNLKVLRHIVNGGGGKARNTGLKYATGRWILFADSDDFYNYGAFDFFDKYVSSYYDYICFCVNSMDCATGEMGVRKIISDKNVRKYLASPSDENLGDARFKNFACWNKMISHDYINKWNIKFEECPVCNDVFFSYQIAYFTKNVKYVNEEPYCCTFSPNSLTYEKRTPERQFLFYIAKKRSYWFHKKLGTKRIPMSYRDYIFIPYMLKFLGIVNTLKFYRVIYKNRKELQKARIAYSEIFNRKPNYCGKKTNKETTQIIDTHKNAYSKENAKI